MAKLHAPASPARGLSRGSRQGPCRFNSSIGAVTNYNRVMIILAFRPESSRTVSPGRMVRPGNRRELMETWLGWLTGKLKKLKVKVQISLRFDFEI